MKYSSKHFEITRRFWNGTEKVDSAGKDDKRVIQFKFDQTGMERAIERATRDLMARTLTPTDEKGKFSAAVVQPLREKLEEWFTPRDKITETDFDKWHAEACDVVLGILRKYYYNDKDRNEVQYGKAQKIVNMTMKGLYCLPGSEQYENHFDYCHIALDSFTLEWFKRNVITWCENCYNTWIKAVQEVAYDSEQGKYWLQGRGRKQKETVMREKLADCSTADAEQLAQHLRQHMPEPVTMKETATLSRIPEAYWAQIREEELRKVATNGYFPAKLTGSRMLSWSVLPHLGNFYYGYDEYVRWIRIYFATNHTYTDNGTDKEPQKPLTPFQAEFYIWSEIQLELAAEAFYGQDIGKAEAVEEANKEWKAKWDADNVDEKDFDEQFKWCKERFKELSLDQKMADLSKRVEHLKQLLSDTQTSVEV